jgi:L-aminopeptidase/D-esterase-like protein
MMLPMPAGFRPFAGLKIGHAQDGVSLTGCTIFLCEAGMIAACDIRGGATGSREIDVLTPGHLAPHIHALVLAGGSAFGLDAASGVMKWCEERGVGLDVGITRVPIVSAANLFDLAIGDKSTSLPPPHYRHPNAEMGYTACTTATEFPAAEGNVGAGTGCTVGKLLGMSCSMKSGIGCWTETVHSAGEAVRVSALAAVNAFGDICDPDSGRILAGTRRSADSREFLDTAAALRSGAAREFVIGANTVLVAVVTDAALTRPEASRLAIMASAGFARTIRPAFSTFDGDIVFALSVGKRRADINALGAAAAEATARAIVRGVTQAQPAGGIPSQSVNS